MTTDHAHTIAGMKLAAAAAAAAAITGSMVLIGWAFDIAVLKSILPGWFPMKANFAVALILLGIALFLITRPPATFNPDSAIHNLQPAIPSRLARFCVLLVGLIGMLTLCEYMFGWNLGIDQWLFREPTGAVGTSHPGRMAQEAALSLVLLAIALWISGGSRKTRWTVLASGSLGLLVATFGLVAILSHLTPGLGAYGWFGFSIMALHAAMMLVILGVAVIAISWQPDVLPWSLSRNTTAAFACGMVVLVFIGFNTSRSQFLMKETNLQIAYIEKVMDNASSFLIEVINTKAQARSYFITGDEQFKTHYIEAQASSNVKLDALRKLVAGHPYQQQQFARIEASANATFQWLQQFIDAKRTGMVDATRNKMVVHGEELLDNFRSTFKQIESEHQQFVEQLKQDSEGVSRLSSLTIAFGTLASLLIFMITVFRLNFAANEHKRKEDEYRTVIYTSLDGFCIADLSGRILDVNEAYCQMLGYTREEFLRLQVRDFEASESPEETAAHFQKFISTGSDRFQTRQRRKDGAILDVEASVQYVAALGERIFSFIRDITERKLVEAKIQRLNQLYNLLSQCNQAVVRSANQEELFQHTCRNAVNIGGFKLAWIGLVDEVSQRVVPVASYGEGVEYLDGLQISVDADSPFGRGPTGTSIRENQPFWCQDFLNDPLTAPWHESGTRFGWGSSASLPLHRKGIAIGAFNIYSGAANAFDEDVRNLLVEMAADISFALDNFAREAERKHQQERTAALLELSTSEETLDEKALLQRGLDTVQHLTDSRIGFLHFVSEDQNEIELVTWSTDTLAHYCHAAFDRHYPLSAAGIWVDSVLLKQPVIINDYATAPGKKGLPEGHAAVQRFVCVPVLEGTQVRMIVGVGNAARDYDERDVETVKLFSHDLYHFVQHKRAIKSLEENEQHFRAVTESANDAIITAAGAGNIIGWNAAAGRLFGYMETEIIGQPLTVLMPERFRNPHSEGLARVVAGGAPHVIGKTVELAGLRKDGSEFPLEFSLAQWQAADGQFFTAIIRDITQRKQAGLELAEQVEELRRWHEATLGREMRTLELKHEVNELLGQAGQPPRYPSAEQVE